MTYDGLTRRDYAKAAGASLGVASLAGCSKHYHPDVKVSPSEVGSPVEARLVYSSEGETDRVVTEEVGDDGEANFYRQPFPDEDQEVRVEVSHVLGDECISEERDITDRLETDETVLVDF